MSKKHADSNHSSAPAIPLNGKSSHSLASDTKMFIPSPNVLTYTSLDKIVEKEASVTEMSLSSRSPVNKAMSSKDTLIKSEDLPQTSRRERKGALKSEKSPCTENEIKVPKKRGRKRKLDTSKDQSQPDTSMEQSQSTTNSVFTHRNEKDTPIHEEEYHSPVRLKRKLEVVSNNGKDNLSTTSSPTKTIVDDQLSFKTQGMLKSSPDTLIKSRRKSKTSIDKVNPRKNQDTNTEDITKTKEQSKRSSSIKRQTRLESFLMPSHNNSISPQKPQQETEDIKPVIKNPRNCTSQSKKNEDDRFATLPAKPTVSIVNGSLNTNPSVKTEDHSETTIDSSIRKDADASHNGDINDTSITEKLNNTFLRGRGRPRGRGRGRGRGRKPSQRSMDTFTEGDSGTLNPSNIQSVTCNKCEGVMEKKQWDSHNLYKHNNMSWIKGGEPMDFELNIKLWRRVLTAAHKKKGQLTCEQCATTKRSVNGFISHLQFCGKSEEERLELMATCPVCNAVMMPSSLETHERVHRQTEKKNAERIMLLKSEENTGRTKRRSAQQALTKISETATILTADNDKSSVKDSKTFQKNVIMLPKDKSKIPSTWKSAWKKELKANCAANCRHIGCKYSSTTFEDICQHCTICSFRLQESFFCKVCQFASESKENMLKHVQQEHTVDEECDGSFDFDNEAECSDDSQNEEDNSRKRKSKVLKTREVTTEKPSEAVKSRFVNKFKFLECEVSQGAKFGQPYIPSIRWTMEFEQTHYQLELFEEYRPNKFLLIENSSKYLPKLQTSMRCKTIKKSTSNKTETKDIVWKTWARFEGGFDEDVPTFFVGGPIWALAWLPIPAPLYSKKPNQYVAISTHPTMENQYTVGKSYVGPNVIQIWNTGHLDNGSTTTEEPPSLSYGIAHNNGTVWCLQWCPSGCYQDAGLNNYNTNENENSLKRMGMLAAACSDGCVHIYSLPFPEELAKRKENKFPIYDTQPVFTLVVNTSIYDAQEQNWQCTKLSWTKEHKHNMVAAGFSNGYIALWDLTIKSPYLMEKRQATYFVNAFQHIFAHRNAVSMVAIVPYNGQRFLASGSIDKSYKFWDLEDITAPQACVKRGIITDGTWSVNWPCAAISFDDAYTFQRTCSLVLPLREYAYKVLTVLAANSTSYSIAINDYGNAFAHGTLSGDVVTIFPHRLLYRSEKMSQRRRLSSFVQIVDFKESQNKKTDKKASKDYNYMPNTYSDSEDRFGIMFNDRQKDNWTKLDRSSVNVDDLTPFPIEQYPFTSVNQVSWNPNSWSHLWLTCGYQSGIVRLLSFKPIPMNPVFTALIPWHAQQMLEKQKSR